MQTFLRAVRTLVVLNCVLMFAETVSMAVQVPVLAETSGARSWDPSKTLVFAVGVLKWQDKSYLQFTTKDRRDAQLVEFFKKQGVPDDKIVYLCDTEATLRKVYDELDEILEKSKPGDTLVFYYCGHGWLDDNSDGYYANYDVKTNDNAISTKKIASKLKNNFRGSTAMFFVDCCSSGSIGDAVKKQPGNYNWGMVTSVVSEKSSTSNWTFSQALLDALNGHKFVDTNLDGLVSFSDLEKYATLEMKRIDNQTAGTGIGNGFSDTSYALAKVENPNETIPRLVEVNWHGSWWKAKVLETKDRQARIRWVQIGYDTPSDDEWYTFDKIRELGREPFNGMAAATTRNDFKVGDSVEVLWKGDFYKAKILKAENGKFYIHYIEDDDSWDEWVDLSRMR